MMRKGVLTLFFILGLIFVMGVVLIVVSQQTSEPQQVTSAQDISFEPVRTMIESCLEHSLTAAVSHVGLQGGYFIAPPNAAEYSLSAMPVYWNGETITMPTLEEVEESVEIGIENEFYECIETEDIQEQGFVIIGDWQEEPEEEVEQSSRQQFVTLSSGTIQASLPQSITVTKNQNQMIISDVEIEIAHPLFDAHKQAFEFLQHQQDTPQRFPDSDLAFMADDYGFQYELINLYENENADVIVSLGYALENNEAFLYSFALDYDWEERT